MPAAGTKRPADGMRYHRLPGLRGPRFLRPWRFAKQCLAAMAGGRHDVTVGFDKTYGQDVLYPQGGLHAASFEHNLRKHPTQLARGCARRSSFSTWPTGRFPGSNAASTWDQAAADRRQQLHGARPFSRSTWVFRTKPCASSAAPSIPTAFRSTTASSGARSSAPAGTSPRSRSSACSAP